MGKEYLPSDQTSKTKIWMSGGSGGDLWVYKGIIEILGFLTNL